MSIHEAESREPITTAQLKAAVEALGLDYDGGTIRAVHLDATHVVVESLATHEGDPVAAGDDVVTRITVYPIAHTL